MNTEFAEAFIDMFVRLGRMTSCDRVLWIGAMPPPAERIKPLKKKLIFASLHPPAIAGWLDGQVPCFQLSSPTLARADRLKAALLGAMSAGYLAHGETILCALASGDGMHLDSLVHVTAGELTSEHASLLTTSLECGLPPHLLEVALELAMRVGQEGYEGHPMGTLFVLGDSTRVMEKSHPLTLNPFQGYSEVERNLLDSHVREAIRSFAMLDGAFVIRDDGVVLAGGRHVHIHHAVPSLPLGLGTRHAAAAAVTMDTSAVAIAVSQSSGTVRLFHRGQMVMELHPHGRRGEAPSHLPALASETDMPALSPDAKLAPARKVRSPRPKS